MKLQHALLLAASTLSAAASAWATPVATFTATGVSDMIPTSMSDDSTIVVGSGFYGAPNLRYTEADGVSVIGDGCDSGVPAISGDGSTILACHLDADGKENAARWLGGTSWQDLGSVEGAVSCDAFLSGSYGVNRDGSLAVGLVYLPAICRAAAGTWDLVDGGPANQLPTLFGDATAARANAVNADGSVIVGWQDQMDGQRTAAKWINGVEAIIVTANGNFNGEALAVSAKRSCHRGHRLRRRSAESLDRARRRGDADRDDFGRIRGRQFHGVERERRWSRGRRLCAQFQCRPESLHLAEERHRGFLGKLSHESRSRDPRGLVALERFGGFRRRQHHLRLGF